MSMKERVDSEIASAMKARDQVRLSSLRMLKTGLINREVEVGTLTPAEESHVVRALTKQRQDSIEQFGRAGRTDLVAKETADLEVLETFLPPALSPEILEAAVVAAIAETGATGPKDMGKVMKAAMARLADQGVDGRRLNELVRARLAGG